MEHFVSKERLAVARRQTDEWMFCDKHSLYLPECDECCPKLTAKQHTPWGIKMRKIIKDFAKVIFQVYNLYMNRENQYG